MSNIVIDDFVISYSAGNTKHTETTVRACIQSALSYEKKYDKTVIEFTCPISRALLNCSFENLLPTLSVPFV